MQRSLLSLFVENYWSDVQFRDSYGETCAGCTFVAVGVNSKRKSHSLPTLRPFTSGVENCQRFAALMACSVKYLLAAGGSGSAESTVPPAFTCRRKDSRTVPR